MAPSCSSKVADEGPPRHMNVEIEDFHHPTYVPPHVLGSVLTEGRAWLQSLLLPSDTRCYT